MESEIEDDTTSDSLDSLPTTAFKDINAVGEVLLHFCTQNLMTDVDFKVKIGEDWMVFSAHKLILCLWSPELADLLSDGCNRTGENAIVVDDVLPSVFETMIKFMYGSKGELHSRRKDTAFILKMTKAAYKYKIEVLKATCCEMLTVTYLTAFNVFDVLEASRFINSDTLQQLCYKFLESQTAQVFAAQELSSVTVDIIKTILNLPRLSFKSEYDLAVWIFAWAKNKSVDTGRDYESCVCDVLPFLKLSSLSTTEFGKFLQNHPDSISDEDALKIFMNIAVPGSRPLPEWCVAAQSIQRNYTG